MFFYILIIPILILSLIMIKHLRNLKKHDEVLFEFYQRERDDFEKYIIIAETIQKEKIEQNAR